MQQNEDVYKQFALKAHPQSWYIVADNLHSQTVKLYRTRGSSYYVLDVGSVYYQWDAVSKSIFLLGGFALENLLKGILVYENPQWISNGRLSKKLKSHSLTYLNTQSNLVPSVAEHQSVLEMYQEGIESWARYPCPLTHDQQGIEPEQLEDIWVSYCQLIGLYSKCLTELLAHDWKGPHGIGGKVKNTGDFFELG